MANDNTALEKTGGEGATSGEGFYGAPLVVHAPNTPHPRQYVTKGFTGHDANGDEVYVLDGCAVPTIEGVSGNPPRYSVMFSMPDAGPRDYDKKSSGSLFVNEDDGVSPIIEAVKEAKELNRPLFFRIEDHREHKIDEPLFKRPDGTMTNIVPTDVPLKELKKLVIDGRYGGSTREYGRSKNVVSRKRLVAVSWVGGENTEDWIVSPVPKSAPLVALEGPEQQQRPSAWGRSPQSRQDQVSVGHGKQLATREGVEPPPWVSKMWNGVRNPGWQALIAPLAVLEFVHNLYKGDGGIDVDSAFELASHILRVANGVQVRVYARSGVDDPEPDLAAASHTRIRRILFFLLEQGLVEHPPIDALDDVDAMASFRNNLGLSALAVYQWMHSQIPVADGE